MKFNFALIIFVIFAFVASPAVALAQDATTPTDTTTPTTPTTPTSITSTHKNGDDAGATSLVKQLQKTSARISGTAAKQATQLSTLQTKADGLITQRITSLNNVLSRIQNDKRLSADEKSTLAANVQSAINGLNALKTKIDADTTVADVRTDGKQIFTTYRVYEEFMPQMQLLIMLDNLQAMADKLNSLLPQVQTVLTTLQGQGVDITAAQAALTDANTQLSTISSEITKDRATVTGITPQTVNANIVLQGVRQDINGVVKVDFQKIRTDIETIRTSIVGQKGAKTTASPTQTSTITPSVSPTSGASE